MILGNVYGKNVIGKYFQVTVVNYTGTKKIKKSEKKLDLYCILCVYLVEVRKSDNLKKEINSYE